MIDHLGEGVIEAHFEVGMSHAFAKRAPDVRLRRLQDEARIWREPQQGIALDGPGKDPLGVGVHQALGTRVAAHGDDALRRGPVGRREQDLVSEEGQGHAVQLGAKSRQSASNPSA